MAHSHHHDARESHGRNLLIAILLNIFITVAQVIGGLISGSLALISDALHNFSDVVSLVISFIAKQISQKKLPLIKHLDIKGLKLLLLLSMQLL